VAEKINETKKDKKKTAKKVGKIRRLIRWFKWPCRLFIYISLLIAVSGVFLQFYLNSDSGKQYIENTLSDLLKREVNIETLYFHCLSGFTMEGLRIKEDPDFSESRDFLSLEALTLEIRSFSLLTGTLYSKFRLSGLTVYLHRNTAGKFNFQSLLPEKTDPLIRIPESGKGSAQKKEKAVPLSIISLPLEAVILNRLADIEIIYIDDKLKKTIKISQIEAEFNIPSLLNKDISGAFNFAIFVKDNTEKTGFRLIDRPTHTLLIKTNIKNSKLNPYDVQVIVSQTMTFLDSGFEVDTRLLQKDPAKPFLQMKSTVDFPKLLALIGEIFPLPAQLPEIKGKAFFLG